MISIRQILEELPSLTREEAEDVAACECSAEFGFAMLDASERLIADER